MVFLTCLVPEMKGKIRALTLGTLEMQGQIQRLILHSAQGPKDSHSFVELFPTVL